MLKIKLMSSFLKKSKDLVKKLEEEIIDHKILEMKIKRMKVSKAKMKEEQMIDFNMTEITFNKKILIKKKIIINRDLRRFLSQKNKIYKMNALFMLEI